VGLVGSCACGHIVVQACQTHQEQRSLSPLSMSNFLKAKGSALEDAIGRAPVSRAKIASDGGLSTETLRRALGGERVINAKANCIVKGLKANGVDVEKTDIFEPA
jgi:hypothetical protein